jgi:hypothetical protein
MDIRRYRERRIQSYDRPVMGLSWEPLPTPKRGYEHEFTDLLKKLATATGHKRAQLMDWLRTASIPPFTTIGAPRIGHDAEADAWLRARVEKSNRVAELEQIQIEMYGESVLELLPPCDGFPVYSNHKVDDTLDRYSFHADLLSNVKEVLGPRLVTRAHTMLLAPEHEVFAGELHEVATKYAEEHALPAHVATIREPVFPEGTKERNAHVLFAAAKWCTYWALRGYGLAVSF